MAGGVEATKPDGAWVFAEGEDEGVGSVEINHAVTVAPEFCGTLCESLLLEHTLE
jgi:hypothetical protein